MIVIVVDCEVKRRKSYYLSGCVLGKPFLGVLLRAVSILSNSVLSGLVFCSQTLVNRAGSVFDVVHSSKVTKL